MLGIFGTGAAYKVVQTATTVNLKTVPGKVGQVLVWGVGSGATIDVYDDPATTNNHIWSWVSADGKGVFALQCPLLNGLTVVTTGATPANLTIVYV